MVAAGEAHYAGISLDTFVDWLSASGHRIERVDDYADWLTRFETAMRALPEAQRPYSALPLIHRFQHPEESCRARRSRRSGGGGPGCPIPAAL